MSLVAEVRKRLIESGAPEIIPRHFKCGDVITALDDAYDFVFRIEGGNIYAFSPILGEGRPDPLGEFLWGAGGSRYGVELLPPG